MSSVAIEASKDGVRFSCQGDIGSGSVTVRQHNNVEAPEKNVSINLSEPVSLTFSLKYLVNFCKASGLSSRVKLCLSSEVPLLVEYSLSGSSYLRFYLAPKVPRFRNIFMPRIILLTFCHRLAMMSEREKMWIWTNHNMRIMVDDQARLAGYTVDMNFPKRPVRSLDVALWRVAKGICVVERARMIRLQPGVRPARNPWSWRKSNGTWGFLDPLTPPSALSPSSSQSIE